METKICKTCGQDKPLDDFSKTWRKRTKVPSHWCWHADCKACNTQKALKWQKDNWDHVKEYRKTDGRRSTRNSWLMQTYHRTLEWYETQYAKQNGKCAICGEPEQSLGAGGELKAMAIDHDHHCCKGRKSCGKCVRGLICHGCNHAIGCAKDSVEILQAMILYLNSFKKEKENDNAERIHDTQTS